MNIYQLNECTKTNILLYQSENTLDIFCKLLNDNLDDAIIVYNIYKWTTIHCTSVPFLKWLKDNSIQIQLTPRAIHALLKNGDKEVLDFINPNHYIDTILSSPILLYVLNHYSLSITDEHIIRYIKVSHVENFILTIIKYYKTNVLVDYLDYLCEYNEIEVIKYVFSKYPTIVLCLKPLFIKAITHNHLELSIFFLSLDPLLCRNINLIPLFVYHSYKTLNLLYTLNKDLFIHLNHNYIFDIISNNKNIVAPFVDWYLTHFKHKIDIDIYNQNIKTLLFRGYVCGEVSDAYFINACFKDYLHVVKQYKPNNYDIIKHGFTYAALSGYLDIVEYLSSYIDEPIVFLILHDMVEHDSPHIHIVQYLYKQITLYPPKLVYYFCKRGYIASGFELDDDCIYLLCSNGYFSMVYDLYQTIDISNAFIYACENGKGLFIAKWLYHTNPLSKQTIYRAFFNSSDIITLKWLYSIESIPIRNNNNAYFMERCLNLDFDILNWLCELFQNYSYSINHGILEYNIDIYKMDYNLENKECSICFEPNTNSMTLCKHNFCYDCINQWYKKNNSCPTCRETINEVYYMPP